MIPVEIAVIAALTFLTYKVAKWWARARTLEEENAKLREQLARAEGTISVLTDAKEKPGRKVRD